MAVISLPVAVYIALASLTLFISVLGNFCVILVIWKNKDMKTATNYFICNLAVSDMFMGAILLPQNIHDLSHTSDYDEGIILCKVVTALPLFCITSSIYSLVAMAVERYRAICTSAGVMNLSTAKKIMAGIWIWSFMLLVPSAVEYGVYLEYEDVPGDYMATTTRPTDATLSENATTSYNDTRPYIRVCGNIQSKVYGLSNGLFLFITAYVMPLILITVCYGKVGYFIIVKTKEQEGTQGGKSFSVSKNKVRILKMLVMVALLFAICWCPYFVILLNSKFTGTDGTGDATAPINLFKLSLSIFSVTYNVYLYMAYTVSFRTAMKNLLCPWRAQEKVMPEGNTIEPSTMTYTEPQGSLDE